LGPLTGLLIQPIIGAMSDKTWHPRWGENLIFVGAIVLSLYFYFRLVVHYGWLLVYYGS
jgi:maltose/moltooligosaccharide transporter